MSSRQEAKLHSGWRRGCGGALPWAWIGGGVVLSPRQMLTSLRAQGAVTVQGAWHPVVVAPKGSV
jgi:hypothetical protein